VIPELDLAVLLADVPDEGLVAGDVGTVVLVHADGAAYEVEFMTEEGDTVAVITLEADEVRPAKPGEMQHARWSEQRA
jgi:hypothetical protein